LDADQSWQKQKKTEQTLDIYGNVTQTKLYDYGSLSTPAKIFNSTFVTDSNYTSRYIRNRLLSSSVSNGSGGGTVTLVTNTYDQYGRPSVTHSPYGADTNYSYTYNPTTVTATTNGKWRKTTVDGLGRTTRVETGDSNGTQSMVDSEYAACGCTPLGKVWRQSNPYAPGGTPVWTTYTYDALGRTVQIDLPQGGSTLYEYKGETTKITDPAGIWKKYSANAFGKLMLVTEPDPQSGEVTTSYSYDLLDHPLQASMTRGGTTQLRTFNYDATTQRLTSMAHPETGTTQFNYNADGTLNYRLDARNQKAAYTYDGFGRVTQISRYLASGAEDTAQRVTFAYDDSPTNGLGRLSQANWKTGGNLQFAYNYAYTAAGLPTSKKMTITKTSGTFTQSGQLETTYSYDTEGKLSSMTYPTEHLDDPAYPGQYRYLATTGLTYNYSYDTLGRPNAMSSLAHSRTGNQAVTWVDNVSYGAAGELLGMRYRLDAANGQTTANYYNETHQYNNRLQLTQLSAVPTGGATTSLTINYVYPANGNNGMLYQASDNLAGEVTYQYDSLNRLISAATTDNSWGLSFTYDGFGNRTDQTVTKGTGVESHLTFASSTNRINSTGYGYDSNGNLTQMPGASGSVTLEYDIENRLTRYYYVAGGVDERYGYGPSNERVWKGVLNQDLQDEIFFYGVDGKLLGRYRPALSGACGLMLTPLGKNVYFAGKLIRSQDRTVVTDRLGSVRIAYNESNGEQLSKYYQFGEEIAPVPDRAAPSPPWDRYALPPISPPS
jgi:YD repeat-containing protein